MWLLLTTVSVTPPPLPDVHPPVSTPSGRLIRYANEVSNTLNTRDRTTSLLDSGLTQLVSNSIYRVSDLVQQLGADYTRIGVELLRSPSFSGSLLRGWLMRVVRDERGQTLHELATLAKSAQGKRRDVVAESAWYYSPGPWVCSRFGSACAMGTLVEGTTETVPASRGHADARRNSSIPVLFARYSRSEPAAQPELRYEPDWCTRVVELAIHCP